MKHTWVVLVVAAVLAGVGSLQAQQTADPISSTMKGSWMNISDLVQKMAERVPEEGYRFKATPELQDFGQRMAHAVSFMMRGCATVRGDQSSVTFSAEPTKSDVLSALTEARAECDAVFDALTDADLTRMIGGGMRGPRPVYAVLSGMVLEHSQEMYGYMAVYLREQGIVPPSSDRNEM